MTNSTHKEKNEPLPILSEQFMWAVENIRERKGTPDEKRFYEIGKHLEKEIKKYIYE